MSVLFTILGIGLVLLIIAIVIVAVIFKKGAKLLWKLTGRGYHKYSSSDYRYRPFWKLGHRTYGHRHYRRKYSSHSGFFSS